MAISNPEVVINNTPVAIIPNSFEYDEGEPEQMVRAAVIGTAVSQEYSQNMEEAFSAFKFSLYPSVFNMDLLRSLTDLKNTNTVTCTAIETVAGVEQTWARTFGNATIAAKVNKPLGADTQIEVTWKSDAAI